MATTHPQPSDGIDTDNSFIINTFGERYLYSVNRNTFNNTGSAAVLGSHFGDTLRQEDTLYIILGSDSGLLPRYIEKAGVPLGSRYLVIELPEILELVTPALESPPLDKRIRLARDNNWIEAAEAMGFQDYVYVDKIRLLRSVGAADAHLPGYWDLYHRVKAHLDVWTWGLRSHLGSATFITRHLDNLADNVLPASLLKGSFAGKTAVILAGGPSLDEFLPWVKQNRERVLIMAVSRICRRLLQEGINPHIVFSIDPTPLSFDISKEMLKLNDEVLFINAYHVNSTLLGQWRGRSLYLGERFPWPSRYNVDNVPTTGPTVTNTALTMALELGCAQVILAGVDLCFGQDGYSHAKGSNEHKEGPQLGYAGLWVETNDGRMAETEESLSQAIHDIASQARTALSHGCRIVNPARNAAKVPFVTHLPLNDIALDDGIEPAAIINQRLTPIDAAFRNKDYKNVIRELQSVIKRLREIKALAHEALTCNAGLFGRDGKPADFKHKRRMDKIESRLNNHYKNLTPLVQRFGIKHFLRAIRPERQDDWTDQQIEETADIYYKAYGEGADALLVAVESALTRIRSRVDEESPAPDFNKLLEQWRNDDQPGRVLVWRSRHPAAWQTLPEGTRDAMQGAIDTFEQQLRNEDTKHRQRCRRQADLSGVAGKALLLFKQQKLEPLTSLLQGLNKNETQEAHAYRHLVGAYIAELENRDADALSAYQSIESGPLLEDALRRICALTLKHNDHANALVGLECLAQLSAYYLPWYAELLKLHGQFEKAADTYARYLDVMPNDLNTLLKLGDLYRHQGLLDGAEFVYRHVLQIDPNNAAAQTILSNLPHEAIKA